MLSTGANDHSIPLTAMAWLWMQVAPLTECALRAPMVLSGLALLVLLPFVMAGDSERRTRWVFTLLLAISPLLVGYSRMARPYALTLLTVTVAFGCLARATSCGHLWGRWGFAYAALSALAAWLHGVMLPFVAAPLLALAWQHRRTGALPKPLLALAGLTLGLLALAVLPPMVHDPAALGAKAGRDLPDWNTLTGVWYMWIGTGSSAVLLIVLVLAATGAGPAWRSGPVFRWTLLGLALVQAAVLVVRPVWISNPLTQARYLLPAVPCLLLAAAFGLVRLVDLAPPRLRRGGFALTVGLLSASLLWTGPAPQTWRHPNAHSSSYYFQFDYRPPHNPVVASYDTQPHTTLWRELAARAPASLVVAVAPFRMEGHGWPAPIWERDSRQRVVPGFLSGACADNLLGEVPQDRRFALRNAVHLSMSPADLAQRVDIVAYERSVGLRGADLHFRPAPACESWLRTHFGAPTFDDGNWLAWRLKPDAT